MSFTNMSSNAAPSLQKQLEGMIINMGKLLQKKHYFFCPNVLVQETLTYRLISVDKQIHREPRRSRRRASV